MTEEKHTPLMPEQIRVLVVEDEEIIRRLISATLKREGMDVHVANNGRSGLQTLLRYHIDVVITDLMMKEMDGLTFLQEALKIWPWLRCIICSGYIDNEVMDKAREMGVKEFLYKPINLQALIEGVRREAHGGKSLREVSDNELFNRNQYQLALLRQISESALSAHSLLPALKELGSGLARLLPCDLVSVLALENDESILYTKLEAPLAPGALEALQKEVLRRHRALTSFPMDMEKLRKEVDNPKESKDLLPVEMKSLVTVPVISGGDVRGMLTLASRKEKAFGFTDISFLYHASHHLSTLLAALGQMRQFAVRDYLTGLFNRRHLEETLERSWLLARRYHHTMSVMVVDIDHFKDINDLRGHAAGDLVLQEFSRILQSVTRASDLLGRYGGDEFIIILPEANMTEAVGLAERINEAIRSQRFSVGEESLKLTASIGIAMGLPDDKSISQKRLLEEADLALYQAKQQGKDRYVVWRAGEVPVKTLARKREGRLHVRPPFKGAVLLVDDDESICHVMETFLKEEGYQAVMRHSVPAALKVLKSRRPRFDLVLADLCLPVEDGFSLLQKVRELDESIVRIVVTGQVTVEHALSALRNGAYDFLCKPFSREELLAVVARAIEYRRLLQENQAYRGQLEEMVRAKTGQVSEALEQIKASYQFSLEAMVAMLDSRERELSQHSIRVRNLTMALARHMNVKTPELEEFGRGALLHDIGKIAIPDAILQKPSALDGDEWDVVRNHPQIGYRFLASSAYLKTAADIVLSHHEHYDGGGYPRGLKGEQICLGARIFAVIDAYDAMRSQRIYKTPMSAQAVLAEIRNKSGTQFDPQVVAALAECQPLLEDIGHWPEAALLEKQT